jgi:hypothetical protein
VRRPDAAESQDASDAREPKSTPRTPCDYRKRYERQSLGSTSPRRAMASPRHFPRDVPESRLSPRIERHLPSVHFAHVRENSLQTE